MWPTYGNIAPSAPALPSRFKSLLNASRERWQQLSSLRQRQPHTHRDWRVDVTGAAINEHGHSFGFVRVHSKFVKDIVPSRTNMSDITQGLHSKLIV